MFLPSGRVHALGAGMVIFEIQQNSDTTYRVFDWNRTGRDGKSRELHVGQSLKSIDFHDEEPSLVASGYERLANGQRRALVACPHFRVEAWRLQPGYSVIIEGEPVIVSVVHGQLQVKHGLHDLTLDPGRMCLLPACLDKTALIAQADSELLLTRPL